jgi:hypothetical protein
MRALEVEATGVVPEIFLRLQSIATLGPCMIK